jgi:hypothetical protein
MGLMLGDEKLVTRCPRANSVVEAGSCRGDAWVAYVALFGHVRRSKCRGLLERANWRACDVVVVEANTKSAVACKVVVMRGRRAFIVTATQLR